MPLVLAGWAVGDDVWFERDASRSIEGFRRALAASDLETRDPEDRFYGSIAGYFASVGDTIEARKYFERYVREATEAFPWPRRRSIAWVSGQIALAQGLWREGIDSIASWERQGENPLSIVQVAHAYDRAGRADSAEVLYRRFIETPSAFTATFLAWYPRVYRRLGELTEARGDKRAAKEFYRKFVDIWANADPEFQPLVREIRAKIARM